MPGFHWNYPDQQNNPPASPFGAIKQTSRWSVADNSPAAMKEKRDAFNTPARYAASMGRSPVPGWTHQQNTPFQHQDTYSSPGASRMDIDSPQRQARVDENGDVVMDATPEAASTSHPTRQLPSLFTHSPSKRRNNNSTRSPAPQPIICLDDSDSGITNSPTKKKGLFQRCLPNFDRKRSTLATIHDGGAQSDSPLLSRGSMGNRRRVMSSERSDYGSDMSGPETMVVARSRIQRRSPGQANSPTSKTGDKEESRSLVGSFFSFIDRHPNLPHILGWYIQLAFNFCGVFFFVYFLYSLWATFVDDINKSANEDMAEMLAEIAVCTKNYRDNQCDPGRRVPAMEAVCNGWDRCMARNPNSVSRARVSARALAEIFNSFIEPISWKAFALIIITFVSITLGPSGLLPKVFSRFTPSAGSDSHLAPSGVTSIAYNPHLGLAPPATPRHIHPDPPSAGGYGATPFSIHYVPHQQQQQQHISKRVMSSPSKVIRIESDSEFDGEDGHGDDGGESELDGSPAPLRAVEYDNYSGNYLQSERRKQASRKRYGSTEAVVGEDPFGLVRRTSVKRS